MKKYLLSMTAIVLAVVLFAFTKPVKKANQVDMYVFEFDGTTSGGFSETNVEDESNAHWKFVGLNQSLCANTDTRACRVAVTSAYVNNPSTPTALSGITIDADESSSGIAYVSSITNPTVNQLSNKQ